MRCFLLFISLACAATVQGVDTGFRYEVTTNYVESLQVTRPGVRLHVPDIGITYEVAERVPLIQQSTKYYIVGIQTFDGSLQLAAFPCLVSRREATGWVTNDKYLIFAKRTPSTSGYLELMNGEPLKIIRRHEDHFEAEVVRNGRRFTVRIPEGMGGIMLVQNNVEVRTQVPMDVRAERIKEDDAAAARATAAQRNATSRSGRKISVTFDDDGMLIEDGEGHALEEEGIINADSAGAMQAARINFVRPEAQAKPATEVSESKAREQVIQELKEVVMLEIVAELQKSRTELSAGLPGRPDGTARSDNWAPGDGPGGVNQGAGGLTESSMSAATGAILTSNLGDRLDTGIDEALIAKVEGRVSDITQVLDRATATAAEAAVAAHPRFTHEEPPVLRFLDNYALMFQILLGVCLLEAILLFNMRLKNRQLARTQQASGGESYSYNFSSDEVLSQPVQQAAARGEEGDLSGTLDGYSMGQVVQFFNSSGDSGILTLHTEAGGHDVLYFHDGQIVDATCGDITGEDAVYAILRQQKGNFSFRRLDTSSYKRVILQDTMSLLLEGHRLVDEMGFDS